MKTQVALFLLLIGAAALFVVSTPADAGQRGAARSSVNGGGGNRASAQPRQANANRSAGANRSTGSSSSRSTSRSSSTSRSREVNVDREVSIDVDSDGCCYNDWDDRDHHPVAAGMAIATTAAVIGSMVNSVPANCVPVAVNGLTYQQCGSTWYQPQMNGSSTTYVVVNPPN